MQETQIKYPTDATLLSWDDIDMSLRARTDFGNLEELAMAIQTKGLLHPPTVARHWNSESSKPYILLGGERRMQAMRMLGVTQFPVNVREQMPEHEVRELELIENFHRKEMKWQEQCVLIARTHRLKVLAAAEDSQSWGTRETGALLGLSNAHISHATVVAECITTGDDEIINASSLFAAYEILLKRKENESAALFVQDINVNAREAVKRVGIIVRADDVDSIFDLSNIDTDKFITPENGQKIDFNLDALFRHGDCLELMAKMPDACVNHVVTDPPYGIDLTEYEGLKNIATVIDTHDAEQNISMFEPFLEQAYRILNPFGFCVFWFDFTHAEKLMSIATKVGFDVQRWPLVWQKLHPCLNNAPRKNFTKNMEFAMVCRRSSSAALTEPQNTSFIIADGLADRKLYDNPFAKPSAAWKFILDAIARPGDTIFDPYAGQCSSLRTVINLGLIPMGCEIDEHHYHKGMLNMTKLIAEINGKVK